MMERKVSIFKKRAFVFSSESVDSVRFTSKVSGEALVSGERSSSSSKHPNPEANEDIVSVREMAMGLTL